MPMVQTLAIDAIILPDQLMRTDSIMQGLGELIEDIAQNGLINPISVRNLQDGRYRLIAGHRRYLAHREMGRALIQANIYELGEGDDDLIMGAENFHRVDVNAVEEAQFYAGQIAKHGISASEVARRYKRSPGHVLSSLSLLSGNEKVLEALRAGLLTKAQAYEINKIKDELGQVTALHYSLNNGMTANAIKHYREGREMAGTDVGTERVMQVVQESGPPSSIVTLLCSFCKGYKPMPEVMVLQGCSDCMSELTKAAEMYNAWEREQQGGQEQ
jgi:ParB/RepB/Spo0J family partition protein